MSRPLRASLIAVVCLVGGVAAQPRSGLQSQDLYKLQSVSDVHASPDGRHVVYSVQSSDRPGRPYSRLWIVDVESRAARRIGPDSASGPVWSPDGTAIAFTGREGEQSGLMVIKPDGSGETFLAPILGTNHPLPSSGDRLSWSPDGRQIAFISAADGPEADANGDPMVITRYLYKPTASEGLTRFNDNRRLHIFAVDIATKKVRQLTTGNYYEHSIDWSPNGDEILFVSNRGPDPDRFFNYDIFALKVADGTVRRLSDSKSAEYRPKWSPDGRTIAFQATTRPLTSSETTMEDTHVWVMGADGSGRRELCRVDNRQGAPEWARDGQAVYMTIQSRGSTRLYRQGLTGDAQPVTPETGSVGAWSLAGPNRVAYAMSTPDGPSDLYVKPVAQETSAILQLTSLNKDLLSTRAVAPVQSLTFKSFDGTEVEAFLTEPLGGAPRAY
jgi:Tol biopolymer transport system component